MFGLFSNIYNVYFILGAYFLVMNLIGLLIMHLDKRKAIKRKWRIPEAALFVVAIIGGSIGSIAGMYLFHHKTRKWYFVIGMPAILVLQIVLFIVLINSPISFATI